MAAVRMLWDRSGLPAGPVVAAQLVAFADALRTAHDAHERSADALVRNWFDPPRWRTENQHPDAEIAENGPMSLARHA